MPEIRTVTTLRSKRGEIVASIRLYERQLEQARSDLAHITAVIRVFEATGDPKDMPKYIDMHRLFKRAEKWQLCKEALAGGKELSTKELGAYVVKAKGFDVNDAILHNAITLQLIHCLRQQSRRGNLKMVRKRHGFCIWKLPASAI
jgi:hypothetical protein